MKTSAKLRPGQKVVRVAWKDNVPYLEYGRVYEVGKTKQKRIEYPSAKGNLEGWTNAKDAIGLAARFEMFWQVNKKQHLGSTMVRLLRLNRLTRRLHLRFTLSNSQ